MGDIPSTWPEFDVEQIQQPTTQYERMLGKEYPVESEEIWGVIIDAKNKTATILVSAETRQETNELNDDVKIESVFKALETQNPDFDRTKFHIEISWINQDDIGYFWFSAFLLYSKEWKLLSYINEKWEILLDMNTFNPYMDSFEENMMKHIWIEIGIWEDWKWYRKSKKRWIVKEWSPQFDRYIISK